MSRYIDADEFYVSQVARCWGEPIIGTCTSDNALLYDELQKSPTSDVVEVKYGEWQKHYKSGTTVSDGFVSSCCDMWNERKTSYCPHCGAKMDEGKERRGMTDKKLTDEEIIKRLERCVKRGNRNYDTDIVLDLINRQKAEIEELKNYINRCKSGKEYWVKCLLEKPHEAINEFAERIRECCTSNDDLSADAWLSVTTDIDNLLKEMVGEEE